MSYTTKDIYYLSELQNLKNGDVCKFRCIVTDVQFTPRPEGGFNAKLTVRDDQSSLPIWIWDCDQDIIALTYPIDAIKDLTCLVKSYTDKRSGMVRLVVGQVITAENVFESALDTQRFKAHSMKHLTDKNRIFVLDAIYKGIESNSYRRYVEVAYGLGDIPKGCNPESYKMRSKHLFEGFGSIAHHDSYPGGYANHLGGMIRIALHLMGIYVNHDGWRIETKSNLDWDYILTAILLHDLGKQPTYERTGDRTVRYNPDGRLSHNLQGVGELFLIHQQVEPHLALSYADFQNLANIIMYHDDPDQLYKHKKPEDQIISYIDGLDAKMVDSLSI